MPQTIANVPILLSMRERPHHASRFESFAGTKYVNHLRVLVRKLNDDVFCKSGIAKQVASGEAEHQTSEKDDRT